MSEELFEIIDDATGKVTGTAPRSRCHKDPSLVHRSVHCYVVSSDGKSILLQKRSMAKDIQPGKWDTSVGGHLAVGEDYLLACVREAGEELGLEVKEGSLHFLFDTKIRNERESENVRVFSVVSDGPFQIQTSELDCVKFVLMEELKNMLSSPELTPVLKLELPLVLEKLSHK